MSDIAAPLPLRPRSTRKSAKTHRFGKVTTAEEDGTTSSTTTTGLDKKSNQQATKPTLLYPGLNDITDAFEAFPTDLVKYFTLLKEIDAKCVQPLPELEHQIKRFQTLSNNNNPLTIDKRNESMNTICNLLNEILPCLEEKMHVASIAADKALSFIDRINDDYDLIIHKELPDSVVYGDSHHPAIMDIKVSDNKSAQSQRSESRREALAARKAVANETDNEDAGNLTSSNSNDKNKDGKGSKARRSGGGDKEGTPTPNQPGGQGSNNTGNSNSANPNKKRKPNSSNRDKDKEKESGGNQASSTKNEDGGSSIQRPTTPSSANKRRTAQKKKTTNNAATTNNQNNNNSSGSGSGGSYANNAQSTTAGDSANASSSQIQAQNTAGAAAASSVPDTRKPNGTTPDPEEPVYCYCGQISYGEMVGCDGADCQREWFHLPCIGLNTIPRGKWYCDDCLELNDKKRGNGGKK